MVHVSIDGSAIIAARAKLTLTTTCSSTACEAQLVEVGAVRRSDFLDNVNNVKMASRKGLATVTREGTVFYYDYHVRSVHDSDNGHIRIGVAVHDDFKGTDAKEHYKRLKSRKTARERSNSRQSWGLFRGAPGPTWPPGGTVLVMAFFLGI